ncbi:MAG: glycine cleavage T C-terminal barrel domain-containing protein [Pseudomonadota bacterium]
MAGSGASSTVKRLPKPFGLLIDRDQPVSFEFEGQTVVGLQGDTIASALVAHGQWLQSRSFKYHRPRGPLTMAGQDANTLVQLPSAPNTLADTYPIADGLQVQAQNYAGSLRRDWRSYTGLLARFLPVGFYYKTFFRPRGIWEWWARFFRRQAGLGEINQAVSRQEYDFDKQYKFADIAIVGGGPAGMRAALEAAQDGLEVILIDENPRLGGSLNYARFAADRKLAEETRDELVKQIEQNSNIEVLCNTVCNGWHAGNWLALIAANRLYKLRAREVIICSGSLEQPAIFRGNDIPGVVMSSAALRLVNLYAVAPGEQVVVLTGNDEGYATALTLAEAGVVVKAIVDMRTEASSSEFNTALAHYSIPIHQGCTVYEAQIDKTTQRVCRVEIRAIVGKGECEDSGIMLDTDCLVMAVGYMPTYQLVCQAGGQLSYDDASSLFSLDSYPAHMEIAGSVNGQWDLQAVLDDGKRAAQSALSWLGDDGDDSAQLPDGKHDPLAAGINFSWPMFPHPKGKEFVDFDEDLQIADIINATRDGYENIQLVKRYSTCGMGPSQGRHSALAAARLVADATATTVAETGVTTARPPFAAETLAHNAGRSFYPARRSNMHHRHMEAGAQMMQAGAWYRPAYYGKADDMAASIEEEVDNVRSNVGIIDVSTLGGIEIQGPDAAEFLNRFYTFAFAKQKVGMARYALLCNEAGVVIDDGVACRLHEHHYYVTATTGGVDRVFQSMLKWNLQWGLQVDISNSTSAWCGVNLAGPNSRQVLARLCPDIDLSAAAFPYMGVREGAVAGIPARIIRVGFVGELGYEVHVPQQFGEALWDAIMDDGQSEGIAPFGVEAQRVLRLEKGHIIIGQDTDAMSNPRELQMTWAVAGKKPFFVGGRSIRELEALPEQRVLVGFELEVEPALIPKEAHLVMADETMLGRVTSCVQSPTLGKAIGLAYVPPELSAPGSELTIKVDEGKRVTAQVSQLPFYDPDNQRQQL